MGAGSSARHQIAIPPAPEIRPPVDLACYLREPNGTAVLGRCRLFALDDATQVEQTCGELRRELEAACLAVGDRLEACRRRVRRP
jgi:hypothetical protein